jgi:hypothetical protein
MVDGDGRQRLAGNWLGVRLLADIAAAHPVSTQTDADIAHSWSTSVLPAELGDLLKTSGAHSEQQLAPSSSAAAMLPPDIPGADTHLATTYKTGQAQMASSTCTGVPYGDADNAAAPSADTATVHMAQTVVALQPQLMAAESLATALLRDARLRLSFVQAGCTGLLLPLLRSADSGVQLCAAAVLAQLR